MDPIAVIVAALTAGATAVVREVADRAVEDGYKALKTLIARKFGGKGKVEAAMEAVEQRPSSEERKKILQEQLVAAKAGQDAEAVQHSKAFLDLLRESGLVSGSFYQAILTGSGAIAQAGAVASGEGGAAVVGDVEGSIFLDAPWGDETEEDR